MLRHFITTAAVIGAMAGGFVFGHHQGGPAPAARPGFCVSYGRFSPYVDRGPFIYASSVYAAAPGNPRCAKGDHFVPVDVTIHGHHGK